MPGRETALSRLVSPFAGMDEHGRGHSSACPHCPVPPGCHSRIKGQTFIASKNTFVFKSVSINKYWADYLWYLLTINYTVFTLFSSDIQSFTLQNLCLSKMLSSHAPVQNTHKNIHRNTHSGCVMLTVHTFSVRLSMFSFHPLQPEYKPPRKIAKPFLLHPGWLDRHVQSNLDTQQPSKDHSVKKATWFPWAVPTSLHGLPAVREEKLCCAFL